MGFGLRGAVATLERETKNSIGRPPEPIERGRVAVEQVAIAVADTPHDAGLAVGGAARTLVARILPEPPAPCRPGQRHLGRVVVVSDPQAAAREDRLRRDP